MFKLLSERLTTPQLDVRVQQLEMAHNHWHSFEHIVGLAERLELLPRVVRREVFGNADFGLINLLLNFNEGNPLIKQFKFFDDGRTHVCVCISDAPLKPGNFLGRNINIEAKKRAFSVRFTDITADEWKSPEYRLPLCWIFNKTLSDKYAYYKELFL